MEKCTRKERLEVYGVISCLILGITRGLGIVLLPIAIPIVIIGGLIVTHK